MWMKKYVTELDLKNKSKSGVVIYGLYLILNRHTTIVRHDPPKVSTLSVIVSSGHYLVLSYNYSNICYFEGLSNDRL